MASQQQPQRFQMSREQKTKAAMARKGPPTTSRPSSGRPSTIPTKDQGLDFTGALPGSYDGDDNNGGGSGGGGGGGGTDEEDGDRVRREAAQRLLEAKETVRKMGPIRAYDRTFVKEDLERHFRETGRLAPALPCDHLCVRV
jgi:hypothetical protein